MKRTLLIVLLAFGCGYRPANAPPPERLAVVGASPLVADSTVVAEVEAGVRAGLAEAGGLRQGSDPPRVVVEVLRIDERSEGVRSDPSGLQPFARAARIGVVGRAWIERVAGEGRSRDTGDVRVFDVAEAETDVRLEALRRADAVRAAARRLGRRLARKILGLPDAADEDR